MGNALGSERVNGYERLCVMRGMEISLWRIDALITPSDELVGTLDSFTAPCLLLNGC